MPFALLNLLIFIPLIGALAVLFIPRVQTRTTEVVALGASALALLLSAYGWIAWDFSGSMNYGVDWIPAFHIRYSLGVDGFSMPLIFLTTLLSTVCIAYSAGRIQVRVREYFIFMLMLESFMVGVFLARDLFLFYVMFDATLIPMYFLIAMWGGERRAYAALKFLLYTLAGSAALLIGILWVYFRAQAVLPEPTFDMGQLASSGLFANMGDAQVMLFFLFGIAFAVKIPIFPLHTWLPDAYVESPPAVTAMLAGAMGKMGVYGFLRLALPFFPMGAHAWSRPLMIMGVISVIYGAFIALAQSDLKRLVAYSSVSHMGFVALGLAAAGGASISMLPIGSDTVVLNSQRVALSGVVYEMFGHGIITGALFLLIGVLGDRAGIRDLRSLNGAIRRAPLFVVLFAIAMFASMAMPGLMGFWGELYIILGSFPIFPVGTALCALGIIITAGFFIWALQRMAFGETSPSTEGLTDIPSAAWGPMMPLFALMFLFGFFPGFYLNFWSGTIEALVKQLGS